MTRSGAERLRPALRSEPSVLIRPATADDLPVLLRNLRSVVKEQIYTWIERVGKEKKEDLLATIQDARSLSIVAQLAGEKEIVGQLALTVPGDVRKVRHVRNLSILVIDGHREQGIGKALMRHAIDWAKNQKGVEKIRLDVFSTNKRAINLYLTMGFEVEGLLRRQYLIRGAYADDIVMGLFVK